MRLSPSARGSSVAGRYQAAAANAAALLPARMDANDPTQHIGIVGAGPAGLFAAERLKTLGFSNVEVLEQADEVADTSQSLRVGDHVFDYSTKFVPATSLDGTGVPAELGELLERCGMELVPSPDAIHFDPVEGRALRVPPILRGYGRGRIVREFTRAYEILWHISRAPDIPALLREGLVGPGETVEDWGRRHDVESFAVLVLFLSDLFLAGPAVQEHATYSLRSRIPFIAGYMQRVLCGIPALRVALRSRTRACRTALGWLGREPGRQEALDALSRLLADPPRPHVNYVLRQGYKEFFRRLVTQRELHVHLRSRVEEVRPAPAGQRGVVVRLQDGVRTFDRLILACPPQATASLLAHYPRASSQFRGIGRDHRIQSWIFEAEGWPRAVGPAGILIDARNPAALASHALRIDGTPYGVSKELAESNVMATAVYRPHDLSVDLCEERLVQGMERLGLRVRRILGTHAFHYPHHADRGRVEAGWFSDLEDLQGRDGLYFTGEVVHGVGVPVLLQGARRMVDRYFGRGEPTRR